MGGGHGQLTEPLQNAGHDVTIYGSGEEARSERVQAWIDGGRVAFRAGDLLRAPWDDGAFDVVLAYRLLPHVRQWRDLVAELARLARRAVIVDYPTRRSVNVVSEALFALKKGVEGDTRPFTVFRDADIEQAFASRGLTPTARRPEFFFPMALHRALGIAPVSRGTEWLARVLGLTWLLGSPVIVREERRGD